MRTLVQWVGVLLVALGLSLPAAVRAEEPPAGKTGSAEKSAGGEKKEAAPKKKSAAKAKAAKKDESKSDEGAGSTKK